MEIGRTFEINGQLYSIKQIKGDRVDASKIIGSGPTAHIQRGRPCKFTYKQVAEALGETIPEQVDDVSSDSDEWTPPATLRESNPEAIRALIDSLGVQEDTSDDW